MYSKCFGEKNNSFLFLRAMKLGREEGLDFNKMVRGDLCKDTLKLILEDENELSM